MAVRKIKLAIFMAVVAVVAVAIVWLPVIPSLIKLLEYIGRLGSWGPVALAGFYVVSCVLLIPASIPTVAAGFLFGVSKGSVTAMVGGTLGACAAYWIGRLLARDWVARRVARSRRFTALDNAADEHAIKVVALSRLSPIAPYAILNYAFGLTKVSFWKYVLGTVIGVAPGMVLYVYFGAGLRSLAELSAYARGEEQVAPVFRTLFWVGLAVTVVVTFLLTQLARRVLGAAERQGHASCNDAGAPESVNCTRR